MLAALVERAATGRGRALDVAMTEGAMQALLPRLSDSSSEDVLRGDTVVAIDHESSERGPFARFVPGLLAQLAPRRGEPVLTALDVARGHGERDRARSVLVRADQDKLVLFGHRDDRDEVARSYRQEPVDLPPVRKGDALLGDLHPRRP